MYKIIENPLKWEWWAKVQEYRSPSSLGEKFKNIDQRPL